ncbi:MAG TPA: YbhB/YbcL family Raf kinase inhibitor-like protein, partial [Chitinophagaceae bacterium]|nr:YbhB/YbcL family Raf kinase inhibitor-like protein [Chitinophagaceae bacterium]
EGVFDHWLIWNLPPVEAIREKIIDGTSGINGFGQTGYGGPCPPPPDDVHRYFFTFYALDTKLGLAPGENKSSLLEAMQGHILATGVLIGRYDREKN